MEITSNVQRSESKNSAKNVHIPSTQIHLLLTFCLISSLTFSLYTRTHTHTHILVHTVGFFSEPLESQWPFPPLYLGVYFPRIRIRIVPGHHIVEFINFNKVNINTILFKKKFYLFERQRQSMSGG